MMAACFVRQLEADPPRRWHWTCAICNKRAGVTTDGPGRLRLSCRRCGATDTVPDPKAEKTKEDVSVPDLLNALEKAKAAIGPHEPVKAAGGRCNCLSCRTRRLAGRGWASATMGDGSGVRSSSPSSSTERAAMSTTDVLDTLAGKVDVYLARVRADLLALLAISAIVDSHASDDDPLPAGAGPCQRCDHVCNSRKRGPNDRLRSGWCPACHRRYGRLCDRVGYRVDRRWYNRASDEELAAWDEPPAEEVA